MMRLDDGRRELWQWDTGRLLSAEGCDQVHFSVRLFGQSLDVDVVDGVAAVPDVLLQSAGVLYAWGWIGSTPGDGYTAQALELVIRRRNKPADYIFTPEDQRTLDEVMARLAEVEEIAGAAAEVARSVRLDADKGVFDGKPGEKGDPGVPGTPGKDGVDGQSPHIGENGSWFVGEDDTGVMARGDKGDRGEPGKDGNLLYATFKIAPETGELEMMTPVGYGGIDFRLRDGFLEVVIDG